MNKILWVDKLSMFACIESGIVLENNLGAIGYEMKHEPDSLEFLTLGINRKK